MVPPQFTAAIGGSPAVFIKRPLTGTNRRGLPDRCRSSSHSRGSSQHSQAAIPAPATLYTPINAATRLYHRFNM